MEHTVGKGCRQLLECAGRAQRRRRFGSFPKGYGNAGFIRSTPEEIQSGVALRFPPHSKTLARSTNGPGANTAAPARATLWTAPAERSGDGALDRSRAA